MSISLPKEFSYKTSTDSQEILERSPSGDSPDARFEKLLQVLPNDEKPEGKDFFELVQEEEEQKLFDGPTCVQISLNSLSPLEKKIEKIDRDDIPVVSNSPFVFSSVSSNLSKTAATVQHLLAPEIGVIFEKMASSMIVMSSSGEVETTLFLDNPSSIFFGTKITIREFSTAPKAFNVEITSFTPAINAIEPCKNDLLSAFQNGNFNFSIHRFETYIHHEERPVLHRKESSDRDDQGRKGGREE
jgi:hypothetical protein